MPTYIVGPKELLRPKLQNGDPNPLWDLLNYADIAGINTVIDGDIATLGPMSDYSVLDLTTVLGVVQFGANVVGYPAWVQVDPTTQVPAYLDERDDKTDPLTWNDWMSDTHSATVVADLSYVPTDGTGSHLKGDVLAQLVADGLTVKSLPEMQALIADNAPADIDP